MCGGTETPCWSGEWRLISAWQVVYSCSNNYFLQPWPAEKHHRMHSTTNIDVNGLHQQKTTPISHKQESQVYHGDRLTITLYSMSFLAAWINLVIFLLLLLSTRHFQQQNGHLINAFCFIVTVVYEVPKRSAVSETLVPASMHTGKVTHFLQL